MDNSEKRILTNRIIHNIMAAEWTHQVSYSPGMIAVCINKGNICTAENIKKNKFFGVSIASVSQGILSSVAGGSSGKEIDKISVLKELGFSFYKVKKIDVLMVKDAALNVECKLVKEIEFGGSHIIFVGEAVDVVLGKNEPLAFYGGKYWKLNEQIEKPSEDEMNKIKDLINDHKR